MANANFEERKSHSEEGNKTLFPREAESRGSDCRGSVGGGDGGGGCGGDFGEELGRPRNTYVITNSKMSVLLAPPFC